MNTDSQDLPGRERTRAHTYLVRTTSRPEAVCPSWCTVEQDQHVAELDQLGGSVLHRGAWHPIGPTELLFVRRSSLGLVEGLPDPCSPGPLYLVSVEPDAEFTPVELTATAEGLLRLEHDPAT